jgi:hypothetical protein
LAADTCGPHQAILNPLEDGVEQGGLEACFSTHGLQKGHFVVVVGSIDRGNVGRKVQEKHMMLRGDRRQGACPHRGLEELVSERVSRFGVQHGGPHDGFQAGRFFGHHGTVRSRDSDQHLEHRMTLLGRDGRQWNMKHAITPVR